jgi:hypothetical protein
MGWRALNAPRAHGKQVIDWLYDTFGQTIAGIVLIPVLIVGGAIWILAVALFCCFLVGTPIVVFLLVGTALFGDYTPTGWQIVGIAAALAVW